MSDTEIIQVPLTKQEAAVIVALASLGTSVLNGYQLQVRERFAEEQVMRSAGVKLLYHVDEQMSAGLFDWSHQQSAMRKMEKLIRAAWPNTDVQRIGAPRGPE